MPNIVFIMPHWLYWLGLVAFPLIAVYAVRRERRKGSPPKLSLVVAYMLWLCAGFAGLHRFYVRSRWGFVFIPLFAVMIFANFEVKDSRNFMSNARQALRTANFEADQAQDQVKRGVDGAQAKLQKAQTELVTMTSRMQDAQNNHDRWDMVAGIFGGIIAALLLVDAFLLPGLVRRCAEQEARNPLRRPVPVQPPPEIHQAGTGEDPTLKVQSRASRALDWVTEWSGELVAWWTVLSIFVYYYEVIVRFLFNSPTNWVHESMFLMFGMQYLIAGAYAYKIDAHVRVDVFYVKFSDRTKAVLDLLTSVFFFVFIGTMLWTGYTYMLTSIQLNEVSFSEWGIQYWPIKVAIPVGAALLLLQGFSKLIKDVRIVTARS
jgi:TRAP-type mannitol/chloroaromatic compound transport system permease small subunit